MHDGHLVNAFSYTILSSFFPCNFSEVLFFSSQIIFVDTLPVFSKFFVFVFVIEVASSGYHILYLFS